MNIMNVLIGKISIAMLLMISMAGAFANSDHDRGGRDGERGARQQQRAAEQPGDQAGRRPNQDQYRAGDNGDGGRKSGRLSPDERRALRRQINEAGQDIYIPKP